MRSKHDVKVGRSLLNGNNTVEVILWMVMLFFIKNITTSTQCAAVRTKFSDIREPPQNLAEKSGSQKYEKEEEEKKTLCKIRTRHHR